MKETKEQRKRRLAFNKWLREDGKKALKVFAVSGQIRGHDNHSCPLQAFQNSPTGDKFSWLGDYTYGFADKFAIRVMRAADEQLEHLTYDPEPNENKRAKEMRRRIFKVIGADPTYL